MSADEIRMLADSCKDKADYYKNMTPCSDLERDKWYRDAAKMESDKTAALLAYAAMLERCEEVRKNCEEYPHLHRAELNAANYILKGATDEDSPHGS